MAIILELHQKQNRILQKPVLFKLPTVHFSEYNIFP